MAQQVYIMAKKAKNNRLLTRTELQRKLDDVLSFEDLSPEEQEHYSLVDPLFFSAQNKKDLQFQMLTVLIRWYFYLRIYIDKEDYSICSKLRDVIAIEKREFLKNLDLNAMDYDETEDPAFVRENESAIRRFFKINQ